MRKEVPRRKRRGIFFVTLQRVKAKTNQSERFDD